MKIRAMTFNTQHCLNFITRKIDYDVMADAILQCNPDIVSLNEMRDEGTSEEYDAQVRILSEKTEMHGYFAEAIRFDGNPYGNGILSRYPIKSTEVFPIPVPEEKAYGGYYEDRCLLKAEIDLGEGKILTVLVIHVGLNPDEAQLAIQTVLAHLPSERCILMGDFNLTPDSPILAPIFERMQDAATCIVGEALSYPSDKPHVKIDYIFATKDITIESSEIPAIIASDHRPHTAVLTMN